jgi:hypothetical protein
MVLNRRLGYWIIIEKIRKMMLNKAIPKGEFYPIGYLA